MQQALGKINIVGVGPGSPDYVTPAARRAVQQAQIVIGAQRSLTLFAADIKGETIPLTAENLKGALKNAAESARKGKSVTILSTGDPGFSGLLHTVLETGLFAADEVNVVPGISSLQACAARLAMSWNDAYLFTFHEGKVTEEDKQKLLSALKDGCRVMLLPDSRAFTPKGIASFLIKAGLDKQIPVYICENLTLEKEKIVSSTLEQVSQKDYGSLCVMVIKSNNKQQSS